ncbi:hypothetical protein NDU88_001986 [Pleurodeles waltl]|uniref:Uncharacterized protein n=1 Tax=Pleurodeles waltl TaxID=8319 RepID=A0AAV7LZ91_PLEWA|nr:hypothetical protein NDU88_001986 [Pleurodeles waltl]
MCGPQDIRDFCAGSRGQCSSSPSRFLSWPSSRHTPHAVPAHSTSGRCAPSASRAPRPSAESPGSGGPRGKPLPMGGSGLRVQGRPQRAPRISHRRIKEEEGGGEPRPESTAGPASPSSRPLCLRVPQSGEAVAALAQPVRALRASARREPPALGPSALTRLPGPGSSQTQLDIAGQPLRGKRMGSAPFPPRLG